MSFETFIGIDYSGAKTAANRLKGLQVYEAKAGGEPRIATVPSAPAGRHRNWSRAEVADFLIARARRGEVFIAGLDHGFSFPASYLDRHGLATWDDFLADFARHWPLDDPRASVEAFRPGNPRTGDPTELRLCERWTSSAKSVFRFDVQGQVAKSTHCGIPWLKRIREAVGCAVHFWPFDGWLPPEGRSVIAEVFPSIFRNRYPRAGRTVDQQDAYAIARWLEETARAGNLALYLAPPLGADKKKIAAREGWILGVV